MNINPDRLRCCVAALILGLIFKPF